MDHHQQQLLSQLKDIHTPNAISMWPATLAWYVVFAAILAILIYAAIRLFQLYFKKRRKQQIINLLDLIVARYPKNPTVALADLSILIRRIALSQYKRAEVAKLHNEEWLNFLDHATQTTEFSNGIGRILLTAPYQKSVNVNIQALANLIERWISRI